MAVNMIKRNVFLGKFAGDLRAAVQSGMVVIGENLYKALAESPAELSRAGRTGMDIPRCMGTHRDARTSGNCATAWKKREELFVRCHRAVAAAVLSCVLLLPSPSYSEHVPHHDDRVVLELSTLGKQGETIVRAREQVLDILQQSNACTAWFQQADPDAAEVFRSLHFEMETGEPRYVYGMRDNERGQILKHPWAAKSIENGGANSTILLNASGAFFNRISVVMQLDPRGMVARPDGNRPLTVSSYDGNTPEAQITILLHELGHITGRLPEDDDSWDGRSSENTSEVLRHCKAETRAAARHSPRGSI